MSTPAAIAFKTENGFCGVRHHWDGYVTGLGKWLYQYIHRQYFPVGRGNEVARISKENMQWTLEELITQHPNGWATISSLHGHIGEKTEPDVTQDNASERFCCYAYVFDKEIPWIMEIWDIIHVGERWKKVYEIDCREEITDWDAVQEAYTRIIEGEAACKKAYRGNV